MGLDEAEVFNAYNERATIRAKDDFQMTLTGDVLDPNFSTNSLEGLSQFIKNLVGYYIIMEGIFFYSGFVMILSFHRQNKMTGIGEQYQYILRDETIHLNFGIDLINGIKEENPEVWTPELQSEIIALIEKAVDLEIEYARDCLPRGILGLKASMFIDYVRHIADRRLERIGLKPIYHSKNPFPWMSETIDLNKEKNFFETRVIEYQTAANLSW
ncbi:ribonucleoside-diphosphate reductase subunit beta [Chlamydia psittaci 06-1683]|nr:ribonucleoside-diphosphate reductase subunit beta [Chlamydia psittaci 06-1683]